MFGVLSVVPGEREGLKERLLGRPGSKRWMTWEQGRIGCSVFYLCTVTLHQNLTEDGKSRRVKLALERLYRKGVRRMVIADEYRPMVEECRMAVVDEDALLTACIPQGVTAWATVNELPLSRLCLRYKGKRANRTIAAGILTLAAHVRTVHLDFEVGTAPLEQRLFTEFGIAARGTAPKDCFTVTLLLDETAPLPGIVLDLTGKHISGTWQPQLQCRESVDIPHGIGGNVFITALYLDGGISPETLAISWSPPLSV